MSQALTVTHPTALPDRFGRANRNTELAIRTKALNTELDRYRAALVAVANEVDTLVATVRDLASAEIPELAGRHARVLARAEYSLAVVRLCTGFGLLPLPTRSAP